MQFLHNPGVTLDQELPLVYPSFQKPSISRLAESNRKMHILHLHYKHGKQCILMALYKNSLTKLLFMRKMDTFYILLL